MKTLLSRSAWAKFSVFRKNEIFLAQNVFMSNILVQTRNQRPVPCAKLQPDWTKNKGARILTWNDTENCLITPYLPHSDDVSRIFMAFKRFCNCPRVPSLGNWTTNKGETKWLSLNRVKLLSVAFLLD